MILKSIFTSIFTLIIFIFSPSCKKKGDTKDSTKKDPVVEKYDSIQTFTAPDSIEIRADLYMPHSKDSTFIVLFHQAGWSRGEYLEIAPKLNKMGFNCMAIDQRSGNKINGVTNITNANALAKGKSTNYVDAEQDMIAAIAFAKNKFVNKKIIIWGSSYSSALVLRIMGENPNIADASLSFAPGEYFQRFGKPADYIKSSAKKITKPIFITSAKNEKSSWWNIYNSITSKGKGYFLPITAGNHGSRALWDQFSDSKEYWTATRTFLNTNR